VGFEPERLMPRLLPAADKRSDIRRSGQKARASGQREGLFGYRKRKREENAPGERF